MVRIDIITLLNVVESLPRRADAVTAATDVLTSNSTLLCLQLNFVIRWKQNL